MNPERALNEQIERYRRMTGEQRLALALDLHYLKKWAETLGVSPEMNQLLSGAIRPKRT